MPSTHRNRAAAGDRQPGKVSNKATAGTGLLGFFPPDPDSYQVPDDFLASTETGNDVPAVQGDPRFNVSIYEPVAGPVLGGTLTNTQSGYAMFAGSYGVWNGTPARAGLSQVLEGLDTFTTGKQFTSTIPLPTVRLELSGFDPDDDAGWNGTRVLTGRPNSNANGVAEWGMFCGSEATAASTDFEGGCIIVLPTNRADLGIEHSGGNLGELDIDWHVSGFSGGKAIASASADTDVSSAMNSGFDIPVERNNEQWLVMFRGAMEKRGGFPTSTERSLRARFVFNGVDPFNVATNTATGGASHTGRGFQWRVGPENFHHPRFTMFRVLTLPTGEQTGSAVINCHQAIASNDSEFDDLGVFVFRVLAFNQFEYVENTTAVTVSSDTWTDSAFEVTVDADGISSFFMGFSTTVHQQDGQVRFRITRNGTAITSEGTDFPTMGRHADLWSDGTDGTGDSDNETIPFSFFWADLPPDNDTTVYKVQYRRNNGFTGANSAIFNSNDNGADGFIGNFFVAEIKLPTEQPTS